MPTSEMIVTAATAIANDWQWLAVGWHLALAVVAGMLAGGWRPSIRAAGWLLIAPLASVSLVALVTGNPFNGSVIAALAAGLAWAVFRVPNATLHFASPAWIARGTALVVFGATYPHFLRAGSAAEYLVASPFGLLPCPTLAVVIGGTLVWADLRPRLWSRLLVTAGALYGLIGVFQLGVTLDWGLLIGTAMLGARLADERPIWRSVRADRSERTRPLPGDGLIAEPLGTLTHAITIQAERQSVWPWLAQMGAGSRAGWYSYDFLDNGRRPSATRIVPELQAIAVGTLFPALPGATDGFTVLAVEPRAALVIGWQDPQGAPRVTWAFALEDGPGDSTRLIVRVRAARGYRFYGLPERLSMLVVSLVHFLMQRRQLLGIARRAESMDPLLDRFVPVYDVVERHSIRVGAPAAITLAAAGEQDLFRLPLIRVIFKMREIVMRSSPPEGEVPHGVLAATRAIGWGVLAEVPGREIVVGAVTRPWEANVTFRSLPPERFAAFDEPGFVKIVWTLRADSAGDATSIFRTETRAVATDAQARARFRRYWLFVSPGIALIRLLSLRPLRRAAERRARGAAMPAFQSGT